MFSILVVFWLMHLLSDACHDELIGVSWYTLK